MLFYLKLNSIHTFLFIACYVNYCLINYVGPVCVDDIGNSLLKIYCTENKQFNSLKCFIPSKKKIKRNECGEACLCGMSPLARFKIQNGGGL